MTASISFNSIARDAADTGRLTGLRSLLRKDVTEWVRGRRAWIVAIVTTAFMALSAANGWIIAQVAPSLPPGGEPPTFSLSPTDNLLAAISSQIFVLAAILAVVSLIATERQAGTLAWTASKPISRTAIWLSKWLSASGMLILVAGLLPLAAATVVVVVLYGAPPFALVAGGLLGMAGTMAFFAALGLAAGTVMPGQAAVAATGFGVFALVPALSGLIPVPVGPFLPTSILSWSLELAAGMEPGLVTPFAWIGWTAILVAYATRRMDRLEL